MPHLSPILLIIPTLLCCLSCTNQAIDIQSYILRDRVVVTDRILMKKALYVSFFIKGNPSEPKNIKANGRLFLNSEAFSESSIGFSSHRSGNIVFDLPGQIPDGLYTIEINAFDDKGTWVAKGSKTIRRADLKSSFEDKVKPDVSAFEEVSLPVESHDFDPTDKDKSIGCIIFARSPLEYVFPGSRPRHSEVIDSLSIKMARNEFEPVTFSLYPLQDLGMVRISIDDLKGTENSISSDRVEIAYVESVEDTAGLTPGKFRMVPKMIRPSNRVKVESGECRRFWLTIRVDKDVLPGVYTSRITILPQYGKETSLPLNVTVVPITLEDIPGIDYFMLMTYEFTELTMPWTAEERKKIYNSACNILKDYRDHGMTTLCPHSPFVFIAKEDGTPNLNDIFANLTAARDVGFVRPIIWYMGHLIQTSKPKHPGNIVGFDEAVHLERLKDLVKMVSTYSKERNCPDVIFLPIDEADDSYQDYKNKRRDITPLLLKTIHEAGAKGMLTTRDYDKFGPLDYVCSSKLKKEDVQRAHRDHSAYWMYNNAVATDCTSPAYARYIYGYYVWENNIDGMTSWTFQNTQNASGWPTRVDTEGRDIYLAYPDPKGPLATIRWEAVREGVDDYKLIYQLIKRIKLLNETGIDTSKYKDFLNQIKQKRGIPGNQVEDYNGWRPAFFKQTRENLISLILEAEKSLLY